MNRSKHTHAKDFNILEETQNFNFSVSIKGNFLNPEPVNYTGVLKILSQYNASFLLPHAHPPNAHTYTSDCHLDTGEYNLNVFNSLTLQGHFYMILQFTSEL